MQRGREQPPWLAKSHSVRACGWHSFEKYNLLQQFYCSYANNPLEKGAVAKGNEMERMFDRFVELF